MRYEDTPTSGVIYLACIIW